MRRIIEGRELLSSLIELPQVEVTGYEIVDDHQLNVWVESTVSAAVCPQCSKTSADIHEVSAEQMVWDLPIWYRQCCVHYAPRRFKCLSCSSTFVERVAWKEVGLNYTNRYAKHVYERARRESVSEVAASEGLSEEIVEGIFERGAKKRLQIVGIRR